MVPVGLSESADEKIIRLEAELLAAESRANEAEDQLARVHQAVRAYKQKQEQVARARKARAERAQAEQDAAQAQFLLRTRADAQAQIDAQVQALAAQHTTPAAVAPVAEPPPTNALAQALETPDPVLDERLNKYLESSFEPDRSRDWMLQD